MVRTTVAVGNTRNGRFAPPPWTRQSDDWCRIDDRLPEDHLARRIDRAVEHLELSRLFDSYLGVGKKAYRPDLLLKLVLYEIQSKRPSPSQWARDVKENEPLRWLVFGIEPTRGQLYGFRDRLIPFLDDWNSQVLQLAFDIGVTKGQRASLDGSTIAANASRRKLANEEQLQKRIDELDEAIEKNGAGEPIEDRPGWMATTPETVIQQRLHYQHVHECLEKRHQENAQRRTSKRKPRDKVLVSLTDPEAALGPDKDKVFRPLYNVQLFRDLDSPLILACGVFSQVNDSGTLPTLVKGSFESVGCKPEIVLTDSGYVSIRDLLFCDEQGITLYAPFQENDQSEKRKKKKSRNQFSQLSKREFTWLEDEQTYRCPEDHLLEFKTRKKEQRFGYDVRLNLYVCPPGHCVDCSRKSECTPNPAKGRTVSRIEHEELLDELEERMQTEDAKELYRLRKQTVELCFADMKEHRGVRRFCGRGHNRTKAQIGTTVLVHNLLTVNHALQNRKAKANSPPASRTRVVPQPTCAA